MLAVAAMAKCKEVIRVEGLGGGGGGGEYGIRKGSLFEKEKE